MAQKQRESKVSKVVKRIYNVAQFESLEIAINHEDTILWSDLEERKQKLKRMSDLVVEDFKQTRKAVMEELELSEKKAYFKNALKSMRDADDIDEDDLLG